MNKRIILVVAVFIVLIAGGVVWAVSSKDSDSDMNNTDGMQSQSTNMNSSMPSTATQDETAMITLSSSGFSPSTLTVKKNAKVTVKNESSSVIQFSSDSHPVHTNEPELNMKQLAAGESGTFTVTKVGSWGYHDHLNHNVTGTLIVTN